MKIPQRILLVTSITLMVVGIFSGCSKEGAEAQKVNVTAMTAALKSGDKDTRINACVELASAGPRAKPAVQALVPLLKDTEPDVRRLAAYALGEIGPESKAAVPMLKELLNDPDRQVVMQVLNSLRNIDPKSFSNMQTVNVSGPPQ